MAYKLTPQEIIARDRFQTLLKTNNKNTRKHTIEEKAFLAVSLGNLPRVKNLLKRGLDPNARSLRWRKFWHQSLLHVAIEHHHAELGLVLLEAGADPKARQNRLYCSDETPFVTALRVNITNWPKGHVSPEARQLYSILDKIHRQAD